MLGKTVRSSLHSKNPWKRSSEFAEMEPLSLDVRQCTTKDNNGSSIAGAKESCTRNKTL